MIDFSQLRVNCSRIYAIMKKSRDCLTVKQAEELDRLMIKEQLTTLQSEKLQYLIEKRDNSHSIGMSNGAKSYLLWIYILKRYGKRYQLRGGAGVAQMERGKKSEPASIELLSAATGRRFFKDKRYIKNDLLTGSIDFVDAPTIEDSAKVYEVKTAFDLVSFMKIVNQELPPRAYFQMQGYLSITGKMEGEVSFALVDFPEEIIKQQRDILFSDLCPDGEETDFFLEQWTKAEASMRFSDIPIEERVITYLVERDEEIIEKIHERVHDCRQWLQEYAEFHQKFILNGPRIAEKIHI